ncbi:MAG TPA: hypothetical protein VG963_03385 [Polyangiaceae bacterium]|nr:hypothetical protein [Polyangiaceae bacterium]
MTQLENTGSDGPPPLEDEPGYGSSSAPEWEADTSVMPAEYCQQLRRISRQLQTPG